MIVAVKECHLFGLNLLIILLSQEELGLVSGLMYLLKILKSDRNLDLYYGKIQGSNSDK